MQKQLARTSNFSSAIGFAAAIVGFWLAVYREGFERLGWISFIMGLLLLLLGFVYCVRAKGYHPVWCLLFFSGFFWLFWFLPDRHVRVKP